MIAALRESVLTLVTLWAFLGIGILVWIVSQEAARAARTSARLARLRELFPGRFE